MSKLSYIQKRNFEKLFDMETWYVINLSNNTFQKFVVDSIWVDPYDLNLDLSKAKLLRHIIQEESDYNVWKLLLDLLDYYETEFWNDENLDQALIDKCKAIASNLKNNWDISKINIENNDNDKTLDLLLSEIESAKDKENPETILDRLHTLTVKHIRKLTVKYNIDTEWKSLSALFWLYIKELRKEWIVESELTSLIVKSNINILERFNYIRNNQSLAHDNEILNSNESILIINNIINLLHFIEKLK